MATTQKHVFISYSRSDGQFARQLAEDLKRGGFPVWIDVGGLTPGTPNWEQAIREAIDHAFAIILVASPASRQSTYVQGELAVAQIRSCPVYPVWVGGDEWINCISLGMANYQYVDCRPEQYAKGVQQLIDALKVFIEPTELVLEIVLPTYEIARFNPIQFDQTQGFLNYLYVNYLKDWFYPMTYGSEWVLVNLETKRIAVSWDWLTASDVRQASLFHLNRYWAIIPPAHFGLDAGSRWGIWEASRVRAVGFATNRPTLEQRLLTMYGSRELMLLHSRQCLLPVKPEEVDLSQYAIHRVMAAFGTSSNRVAFVDTENDCDL